MRYPIIRVQNQEGRNGLHLR